MIRIIKNFIWRILFDVYLKNWITMDTYIKWTHKLLGERRNEKKQA